MVTHFSRRKDENLDSGAKHFPGKTPFTGCHTDSFKTAILFSHFFKDFQVNERNTSFNSCSMYSR